MLAKTTLHGGSVWKGGIDAMNALPGSWRLFACLALSIGLLGPAQAAEPGCGQSLVDGTSPPPSKAFIYPRTTVRPFYQWESNNGYCGEVSLMEAALANGQWMSQFNTRLLCGSGLSQSGVNGACAAHKGMPNFNAQMLIESPGNGITGPNRYANAAQCAANARLAGRGFDSAKQRAGMAGYRDYLSWVKAELIAGHHLVIGVLVNGDNDRQYDHEVAVIKIGTNHAVDDPTYYPDDVLYFDDHGLYTLDGTKPADNPAIPPGAGKDTRHCTPYVYGYSFDALAATRAQANRKDANAYSIVIPGAFSIRTITGGSGYGTVPIVGPHNVAYSVSGPADTAGQTLPVSLSIVKVAKPFHPVDPIAGYNYENPMIGTSVHGNACTNIAPQPMSGMTLRATVTGLTVGTAYNLYEYEFDSVKGVGNAAALAVPVAKFNANAAMATHVTKFTAATKHFVTNVTVSSDKIVVFRAVPASAP